MNGTYKLKKEKDDRIPFASICYERNFQIIQKDNRCTCTISTNRKYKLEYVLYNILHAQLCNWKNYTDIAFHS